MLRRIYMKDTKLFRILALFSPEEYKKFGDFAASPYFNKLNNVTRLYAVLKKHHPEFRSNALTKENIFGKIFPGEKYNDVKIRALFSYLFSLAEKFTAAENLLNNDINIKLETAYAFFERHSGDFAEKKLFSANKLLHEDKTRDEIFYYTLYKILYQKNTSASHFSKKKNCQKETDALTIYLMSLT